MENNLVCTLLLNQNQEFDKTGTDKYNVIGRNLIDNKICVTLI